MGEDLGIPQSTLSNYEAEFRKPDIHTLKKIAEYFGVSIDFILNVDLHNNFSKENVGPLTVDLDEVPIIGKVAAGPNGVTIEEQEGRFFVPKNWHVDYAMRIKGHSMYPKYKDGDIVFIRKQPVANNGQIAVVKINGNELVVKRFFKRYHEIVLVSENPDYDPIHIKGEEWNEECTIIGIVIGKWVREDS